MNNFEKLKTMSIDDISKIMESISTCNNCVASEFCLENRPCGDSFKEWLLKEVE